MHVTQKATTTTTSDCPVPSKVSSVSLICSSSDGCYGCPCCCCSARYVEPQMKEMSCDMTMRRIHMQGTYHFDIGTYKNKNNILCVIHVCVDMCHGRRRWLIKIIKCKCSAANQMDEQKKSCHWQSNKKFGAASSLFHCLIYNNPGSLAMYEQKRE